MEASGGTFETLRGVSTPRQRLLERLSTADREAVLESTADLGLSADDPLFQLLAGVAYLNERHLQALAEREARFLGLIRECANPRLVPESLAPLTPGDITELIYELRALRRLSARFRGLVWLAVFVMVGLLAIYLAGWRGR